MKYIIISFKSQNSLYTFGKILRNFNISSSIISTPHAVYKSCSLSLKTTFLNSKMLIEILKNSKINDVIGIFLIERVGFNERIQRLYWLFINFLIS